MKAEILYDDFIDLLKKEGKVRASPSHEQRHPVPISEFAILDFQYDGVIFAITRTGKRVEITDQMPAFRPYDEGGHDED